MDVSVILSLCREADIGFTAIVRSHPERITDIPPGSRVVVVPSLADHSALADAFDGADAVITALGVTSTSRRRQKFRPIPNRLIFSFPRPAGNAILRLSLRMDAVARVSRGSYQPETGNQRQWGRTSAVQY
ncbi:MAG: NAD(P)H-binding protein [Cyanobacteria bacterium P01_F01_bin.150]